VYAFGFNIFKKAGFELTNSVPPRNIKQTDTPGNGQVYRFKNQTGKN
jgi:hypothetical protein